MTPDQAIPQSSAQLAQGVAAPLWTRELASGRFLFFNDAYRSLWQHPPESWAGGYTDWLATIHAHDRDLVLETYQRVAELGNYELEYHILLPDESIRVVKECGGLLDGNKSMIAGATLGVSRPESASCHQWDQKPFFLAMMEAVADAVVVINHSGRIIQTNKGALDVFGYSEDELLGHNVKLLMPEPDQSRHDQYIKRYLHTGKAKIIGTGRTTYAVRKDGEVFPIELSIAEIDHLQCFVGVIHDISKRRALEKRQADAKHQERQAIAQEIHDGLGGQLTGVELLTKALAKRLASKDSSATHELKVISTHLQEAHRQLRQISRGIMPVEGSPQGLEGALQKFAQNSSRISPASVVLRCDPQLPITDSTMANTLFRIAQEATTNAIKHASAKHILIQLCSGPDTLTLVVEDDGVGIQEKPDGHDGLGLHTMKQRAGLIGANLILGRREGGGTTVKCLVYLPSNDDGTQRESRKNG
ncbi:PAS domain S-box protein [Phycisphaeraceae bacterium D3-23]